MNDGEAAATAAAPTESTPEPTASSSKGEPSSRVGVEYDGSAASSARSLRRSTLYGFPTCVACTGAFPRVGSTLGPYFCLGQLGHGTFSSIHRALHMTTLAPAAAKVELGSFQKSGLLEQEAVLLHFLARHTPPGTVPAYLGYYKATAASSTTSATTGSQAGAPPPPQQYAALLMEQLPGRDLHQIRETLGTRRMHPADAVYFCADVLLPLLRALHAVGVVHRDVKPSNVVRNRAATTDVPGAKTPPPFTMVDFGLSRSIVAPGSAPEANHAQPWPAGQPWLNPDAEAFDSFDIGAATATGTSDSAVGRKFTAAYVRRPRFSAEFRGTSMYASLRVHQLWDYSFRDDLWSLAYVFCDLVSGGLPWMSHAKHRDRAACQRIKERVHGLATTDGTAEAEPDQTELLLMGDNYHLAKYKRDQQLAKGLSEEKLSAHQLPEPLALCRDSRRVGLLRQIFAHLADLQFGDVPDYDLVQRCLREFAEEDEISRSLPPIPRVQWDEDSISSPGWGHPGFHSVLGMPKSAPQWRLVDAPAADPDLFKDVSEPDTADGTSSDRLSRLPLEFQFRIRQMEFHASQPSAVPPHVALREWLDIVLPLLYGEWNVPKYEGGNRTSSDGLRRDLYLDLLKRCKEWLSLFGGFRNRACYFLMDGEAQGDTAKKAVDPRRPEQKRRKVETERGSSNMFVNVSRAIYGLENAYKAEARKRPTPSIRLTFAS